MTVKARPWWTRICRRPRLATDGGAQGILEGFVDFSCEISVIVARAPDGAMALYPPVENRHVNHILRHDDRSGLHCARNHHSAEQTARHIAEQLDWSACWRLKCL